VFAKWSSRLGGSVFFSRSSSSTVGVGAAGAASRVGSLDLDVSRATAWPAMRRRIATARRSGTPAAMASDSPKSSRRRMVSRPASRNAPTTKRTASASSPRPTSSQHFCTKASSAAASLLDARESRDAAGLGLLSVERGAPLAALVVMARVASSETCQRERGGKQARAVARRARGARGEAEPREVLERVAAGRRRGGAARRARHVHEHAPQHVGRGAEGTDERLGTWKRPSRPSAVGVAKKIRKLLPAATVRSPPSAGLSSPKVNSALRDRGNGNDRQIDTRDDAVGGTSSARSLFFAARQCPLSPRERFSRNDRRGGTACLPSAAACQLFQDLPPIVARPFFVDLARAPVSVERELLRGRVARRPPSGRSSATTTEASPPSSSRPLPVADLPFSLSRDVFPSARVSLFAHARKPFVCPAFLLSTKIHGPT
jgi:hypothetical protein